VIGAQCLLLEYHKLICSFASFRMASRMEESDEM